MDSQGIRLQKVLAQAGIGSRRACDDLVETGRVTVNGRIAEPGTRVDPARDDIRVDGNRIGSLPAQLVLAFHKPAGVVTTMSDPQGRPNVGDLLRVYPERLFHVGRLDEATEGLLLLTNDGDFANLLMHPSHGVEKAYLATVSGRVAPATLEELRRGVELGDGPARAIRATVKGTSGSRTVLELVLHEGRKRIVRRMCKAVGHPVERLVRTRIGSLELGSLEAGEWRPLQPSEIAALKAEANVE